MNRSTIIIIVLFSVLSALLLLYFIFFSNDEKHFQWHESYRSDSDQPYGTSFIKKLLETYRPGAHFTLNDKTPLSTLLADSKPNTDYVLIGQTINLEYDDVDKLLKFINEGNDAFIACLNLPTNIIYRFYENECGNEIYIQEHRQKSVTLNFYHDTLKTSSGYNYAYRFRNYELEYFWGSLAESAFCDSTMAIVPLGYQDQNQVNFFKFPYGKGNLYIHTNPLVFTNYFLTKEDKIDYVSGVFSHLKGNDIIWDEFSKIQYIDNNNGYNSPLYFIMGIPSLKYAWWLLMAGILLYILFAAKRMQRVIPVREPKSNTSLEFVKLISALHYQNENHLDMARKKMKYFQYFIRSKYGIHAHTLTEELSTRLAEKSKVSIDIIKQIAGEYALIEKNAYYNTEANRLISFYVAVDNFYKHCK